MTWWNRPGLKEHSGIICDGAIRSGKTLSLVCGFFLWSMSSFQGEVFALCGKTVGALRRNIISHLGDWLGDSLQIREFRSENKLLVFDGQGRCNIYYLFGAQDERACQLIQGITLAGVLLDEVVLMPRSFVEQACARCSQEGAKLWMSCNPQSPQHWFYTDWLCRCRKKNLLQLHFTMQDNPALSPKVRQRYAQLYTGLFYRRFVLGQWCMSEGLVYAFDPERHVTDRLPTQGRYYISVDYGTCNPFSAGLWCVSGGCAWRIREYYHDGKASGQLLTDGQYYEQLEKLAGTLPVDQVIVDPSAASFITLIRQKGRFSVRKARNQVESGIRLVAGFLQEGRLLISPACRDAIREFGLYSWDRDDRPKKENDHAMDDIRYFCATVLRRTEGRTERRNL